jgi:hypothetical protein
MAMTSSRGRPRSKELQGATSLGQQNTALRKKIAPPLAAHRLGPFAPYALSFRQTAAPSPSPTAVPMTPVIGQKSGSAQPTPGAVDQNSAALVVQNSIIL